MSNKTIAEHCLELADDLAKARRLVEELKAGYEEGLRIGGHSAVYSLPISDEERAETDNLNRTHADVIAKVPEERQSAIKSLDSWIPRCEKFPREKLLTHPVLGARAVHFSSTFELMAFVGLYPALREGLRTTLAPLVWAEAVRREIARVEASSASPKSSVGPNCPKTVAAEAQQTVQWLRFSRLVKSIPKLLDHLGAVVPCLDAALAAMEADAESRRAQLAGSGDPSKVAPLPELTTYLVGNPSLDGEFKVWLRVFSLDRDYGGVMRTAVSLITRYLPLFAAAARPPPLTSDVYKSTPQVAKFMHLFVDDADIREFSKVFLGCLGKAGLLPTPRRLKEEARALEASSSKANVGVATDSGNNPVSSKEASKIAAATSETSTSPQPAEGNSSHKAAPLATNGSASAGGDTTPEDGANDAAILSHFAANVAELHKKCFGTEARRLKALRWKCKKVSHDVLLAHPIIGPKIVHFRSAVELYYFWDMHVLCDKTAHFRNSCFALEVILNADRCAMAEFRRMKAATGDTDAAKESPEGYLFNNDTTSHKHIGDPRYKEFGILAYEFAYAVAMEEKVRKMEQHAVFLEAQKKGLKKKALLAGKPTRAAGGGGGGSFKTRHLQEQQNATQSSSPDSMDAFTPTPSDAQTILDRGRSVALTNTVRSLISKFVGRNDDLNEFFAELLAFRSRTREKFQELVSSVALATEKELLSNAVVARHYHHFPDGREEIQRVIRALSVVVGEAELLTSDEDDDEEEDEYGGEEVEEVEADEEDDEADYEGDDESGKGTLAKTQAQSVPERGGGIAANTTLLPPSPPTLALDATASAQISEEESTSRGEVVTEEQAAMCDVVLAFRAASVLLTPPTPPTAAASSVGVAVPSPTPSDFATKSFYFEVCPVCEGVIEPSVEYTAHVERCQQSQRFAVERRSLITIATAEKERVIAVHWLAGVEAIRRLFWEAHGLEASNTSSAPAAVPVVADAASASAAPCAVPSEALSWYERRKAARASKGQGA